MADILFSERAWKAGAADWRKRQLEDDDYTKAAGIEQHITPHRSDILLPLCC